MSGHEWGAEGVRGDAAGQPDGQDAETGQSLSHTKIQDEDICFPHVQGLISPARLGEDGRPEAVEHVLQLIEDRGDQDEAE